MANLFNQNIRGTNNYKGILNLGSSIGTALPTTGNPMVYITDGDGANLPIQVAQDKLRFDVNVGIGGDPSASYGLYVQSSSGTVLANRYHFAVDRYLDASGVTFPTATNYTFSMGGVNQLIVNNTNVVANNSIDFGTAGTPPSIGSYLTSGYSSNGEYMRFYSGHNAQYALANYQFNVANRTFNNASVLSGSVASIIDIPSHTFSIANAGATNVNYRGISLAYTINNSVTAAGLASGIRIDATLTNLNGMINEAFRYTLSGITSTTAGSLSHGGIDLINSSPVTGSMGWQNSPSLEFEGKTLRGNIAATSIVVGRTYIIQTVGTTDYTLIGSANNTVNTVFVATGVGTGTGTVFESQPVIIRQSLRGTNSREYNLLFESSILGGAFTEFGRFGWDQYGSPQFLMGSNSQITASGLSASAAGITASRSNSLSTDYVIRTQGNSKSATTGDSGNFIATLGLIPTSGNATISGFLANFTVNQTGTANGISRAFYALPILTRAADFRAYSTDFTFAAPASSAFGFRGIDINYIINNGITQTGIGTGIFLNAVETALNSMTHRLIDLQVSGVSRFRINNNGTILANLQTGNAGLIAGELYKDTAANILSNGDFVVGMKA